MLLSVFNPPDEIPVVGGRERRFVNGVHFKSGEVFMADEIDLHVAKRMGELREIKGCSRSKLAREMGISAQRIAKYETGRSLMGSSLLYRAAKSLSVPVSSLFDGLKPEETLQPLAGIGADSFDFSDFLSDHTGELIAAFESIDCIRTRRALVRLFESVAESPDAERSSSHHAQ